MDQRNEATATAAPSMPCVSPVETPCASPTDSSITPCPTPTDNLTQPKLANPEAAASEGESSEDVEGQDAVKTSETVLSIPPAQGDDGSQNEKSSQWSVHWYLPSLMIALYIAGVCTALGHHFYYSLHQGRIVHDDGWPLRIGIGLAFLARACFVGSVQIAYKQWAWVGFLLALLDW